MIRKPMLAVDADFTNLRFPYYGSYKLDGYRAFNQEGRLHTRSGKLIVNPFVQSIFGRDNFDGLDGELIIGKPHGHGVFNRTSGPLRRHDGEPDVTWYLFDDRTSSTESFQSRYSFLTMRIGDYSHFKGIGHTRLSILKQVPIADEYELREFEEEALGLGYEGVILRSPTGVYKHGRSTLNENLMLKVKRFTTAEARIIDIEEQMINDNVAFFDELGRTRRSGHKENKRPSGMVGSFVVESPEWPRPFKISAGSLSHDEKRQAMLHPEMYLNQLARYSYFPYGVVEVPRNGIFDGIRDPNDMGE